MRDNMFIVDMKKCFRRFEKKTIPGVGQRNIFKLIMDTVYDQKGIDASKMSEKEYDDFLKSADPMAYAEMQEEFQAFQATVERMAEEKGVKIVSKKELDKYSGQYGISLREALEGKEPDRIK